MLIVSNVAFANELNCTTVSEWNVDRSSRTAMGGIEWRYDYFVDFAFPSWAEEISVYDKEWWCNEYQLWKLIIICQWDTAVATFDWKKLEEIPEAYDSKKNTIYSTENTYTNPDDFHSGGKRVLKACMVWTTTKAQATPVQNTVTQPTEPTSPQVETTVAQPMLWMNTQTVSAKEYKRLKNDPLFVMVEHFGYNWKKDRNALARQFGIQNYVWTAKQNIVIKQKLLSYLIIE